MFSTLRKTFLTIFLLSLMVFVHGFVFGQGPDSTPSDLLDTRIHKQDYFVRTPEVNVARIAASQGLKTWYAEPIISEDATNWTLYDFSLAMDIKDRPHIVYIRHSICAELRYAYYDGVAWQVRSIGGCTSVKPRPSLGLDVAGRPHISYAIPEGLVYVHYDGALWQQEIVDSADEVGMYSSLALDDEGYPHISYIDSVNDTLKYAYYNGVTWHIETLAKAQVGSTSMALDAVNRPHIVYIADGNIKHAYHDGILWQTETVSGATIGDAQYIPLVLDAFERPHIVYYDQHLNLNYAYFNGDDWHAQVVSATPSLATRTSLHFALDGVDRPHISYAIYDWSTGFWGWLTDKKS